MRLEAGRRQYRLKTEVGRFVWVAVRYGNEVFDLHAAAADEWVRMGANEMRARPVVYYYMGPGVGLDLWPVPDEDGELVVRYAPPEIIQ